MCTMDLCAGYKGLDEADPIEFMMNEFLKKPTSFPEMDHMDV